MPVSQVRQISLRTHLVDARGPFLKMGQSESSSSAAPFIGRQAELAALEEGLTRARHGSPRVMAVEGVSGIGKTSLVHQFVTKTCATRILWCSGDQNERCLAWGLLGQLADVARSRGLPQLAELGNHLEPETDPLLVGTTLLRFVKENEVALVVVDDADWADQQSLAAARFAFRRLAPEPVLVILTYRPEQAFRLGEEWRRLFVEQGLRIRLGGLSVPELVVLSEAVTGIPLSQHAAVRLFEQTSGNPLYARSLLEQLPLATFEQADGPLPAPFDLANAVLDRLRMCKASARKLVTLASVLGASCSVVDLRTALGAGGFSDALDEGIESGLLREVPGSGGRQVAFPDPLARSAVYHTLLPRQRRELHGIASRASVGRAALEHRAAASAEPDSDLAAEAEKYAIEDMAAGCFQRGATEFRMAATLTPSGPARRSRLLAAIEAFLMSGDVSGAQLLARDLAAESDEPWREYIDGYLAFVVARIQDSEAHLTRARSTLQRAVPLEGAPDDLAARVSALLAVVGITRLDCATTLRYSEEVTCTTPRPGDWPATLRPPREPWPWHWQARLPRRYEASRTRTPRGSRRV